MDRALLRRLSLLDLFSPLFPVLERIFLSITTSLVHALIILTRTIQKNPYLPVTHEFIWRISEPLLHAVGPGLGVEDDKGSRMDLVLVLREPAGW